MNNVKVESLMSKCNRVTSKTKKVTPGTPFFFPGRDFDISVSVQLCDYKKKRGSKFFIAFNCNL